MTKQHKIVFIIFLQENLVPHSEKFGWSDSNSPVHQVFSDLSTHTINSRECSYNW